MANEVRNAIRPDQFKSVLRNYIMTVDADESGTVAARLPPIMLWGPAGIGKSACIKAVAKEMGCDLVDVRLPQMEAADVRGIPSIDKERKCVEWLPSSIFPRENTIVYENGERTGRERPIILFLDELSGAPKDIQLASYELILDRQLGGGDIYKVPNKCIIVAAGNRSCDRAVSVTISSALANRMMHFEMVPNFEDWLPWAMMSGINPNVVAFLKFADDTGKKLFHDDSPDTQNLERGYPTPRSWARVGEIVDTFKTPNEVMRLCVYGLVGEIAGRECMEFIKTASQMANVEEMMTDPNAKIIIPTRADLLWSLVTGMVYHVWRGKDNADTTNRVKGFLRIAMKLKPAYSVMAMKSAILGTEKVSQGQAKVALMKADLATYKEWLKAFGSNLDLGDCEV